MELKIAFLIIVVSVSNVLAISTYSQVTKVSLDMENKSLEQVMDNIESQSEFYFIFNQKQIDVNRVVSIQVENKLITDILPELFKGTNVNYLVFDRKILLTTDKLEDNLQSIESVTEQQQKRITGRITDETGKPMPGVNIQIEGTTTGAISDGEGKYSVDLPGDNAVIIFSFIGYNNQKVSAAGKTVLDIAMVPSIASLNEVVVVGYGVSSRKKLASAVTSVSSTELNKGSISDVGQLLQGKVPGLNISASGDPNRPAAIVLRGASTLNSAMSPFYVIDGVPGADISTVAPADIATIDILKDAAATAIYGNRAANGVIMVTTKKGKIGKLQVSYNGYFGMEKVSNQLNMMNSTLLRNFVEGNEQAFLPADDQKANTDWQSAVERNTAFSNSHNISFNGGTEHNNYSASLNYINKQGILLKSNQSNVIARLSVDQTVLNDKVKFSLNLSNANIVANNVPFRNVVLLQAVKHLPVTPVRNSDGTYFENFSTGGYVNPVAIINHGQDDTKYNNLIASFNTHIQLPFGLTYDLNLSYQNYSSLHGEFYDSYYADQYNSANFYNNPDPPATHSIVNFGLKGAALRNSYQNSNKILETYLTWNKKFGEHSITAVIGYSWQGNVLGDGFQATSTNFPVDNIGYNNLALSNYSSVPGYLVNFGDPSMYQETRLISDFARLNYNFNDRYLLQLSVRKDGSSVFGANNQWGYFPSVGAAWRISQEGFMQDQTIFSDLKLRASYGVTGNSSGFNAYTAQFLSGSLGTFYFNGAQTGAYGPFQAANADLKWEKTSTTNIGIDFSIMKGKIGGSVEWYDKETTGMIYPYTVDQILIPAGSIVANGGSVSNKGIEVSINFTPVDNAIFTWTSNLNLAHNVNLIKSLSNPMFAGGDSVRIVQPDGGGQTGSTLQILKAGKPLGEFFTLQYAGKNDQGVSQYVDYDGNLTTKPAIGVDYHYAGSAQPKLLLGWTNDFRYKNFDLNIFFRGVFGNKIFNATRADLFRPADAHIANILVDAAWESPADINAYKYSTRFIEDGSYLRFDNATLGYNFKRFSQYIDKLRVYASVNNLFVITKYKGVDPEINQGGIAPGIDANNFYPKTRTILFGVNLTF